MKTVVTILAVFITQYSFGQGQKYIFAEVGGASALAAVNFDMRFKPENREGFGFRAGVGHTLGLGQNISHLFLPLGVNYVHGKNRNALLVGMNGSLPLISQSTLRAHDATARLVLIPEIGYRFRPKNRGVAFHASYTPLLNSAEGPEWLFVGLGVGYSWK